MTEENNERLDRMVETVKEAISRGEVVAVRVVTDLRIMEGAVSHMQGARREVEAWSSSTEEVEKLNHLFEAVKWMRSFNGKHLCHACPVRDCFLVRWSGFLANMWKIEISLLFYTEQEGLADNIIGWLTHFEEEIQPVIDKYIEAIKEVKPELLEKPLDDIIQEMQASLMEEAQRKKNDEEEKGMMFS